MELLFKKEVPEVSIVSAPSTVLCAGLFTHRISLKVHDKSKSLSLSSSVYR